MKTRPAIILALCTAAGACLTISATIANGPASGWATAGTSLIVLAVVFYANSDQL